MTDTRCDRMQDNPFADSTLYDVNTTYVPPDFNDTVDAVVPAVTAVPASNGTPSATQPAAAVQFPAPVAPAAPVLQFTGMQHTDTIHSS